MWVLSLLAISLVLRCDRYYNRNIKDNRRTEIHICYHLKDLIVNLTIPICGGLTDVLVYNFDNYLMLFDLGLVCDIVIYGIIVWCTFCVNE